MEPNPYQSPLPPGEPDSFAEQRRRRQVLSELFGLVVGLTAAMVGRAFGYSGMLFGAIFGGVGGYIGYVVARLFVMAMFGDPWFVRTVGVQEQKIAEQSKTQKIGGCLTMAGAVTFGVTGSLLAILQASDFLSFGVTKFGAALFAIFALVVALSGMVLRRMTPSN